MTRLTYAQVDLLDAAVLARVRDERGRDAGRVRRVGVRAGHGVDPGHDG
jgi:hypothetical protein